MKNLMMPIMIGAPLLGLAVGWQLKPRLAVDDESFTKAGESDRPATRRARDFSSGDALGNPAGTDPSDTAADLHALPAGELYERMARFLLKAEPGEFPAFYEEFKLREDRNNDLNDLLFIAWTRVAPEAAVAATRGTDDFKYSYWAWACHDPGAALAATQELGEGAGHAAWGIGEFHPQWLADHWDLIPGDQHHNAIQGLAKWPDTETPEATLRLLLGQNYGHYARNHRETFLALGRKDPASAYQLMKELESKPGNHWNRNLIDTLINTMSRHEPELLSEMAAVSKSPLDRNKIQLAKFRGLLRSDPEAAQAAVEEAPKGWLKDDLGIAMAHELFSKEP